MSRLLLILLSLLVFCSCEKVSLEEPSTASETTTTTKQKGNLIVNVFQLEQTPFSSITRSDPADACTHLNFAVYGLDGTRIKQINQTLGDTDFGKTSFQLQEGTYRLVVVAHSSSSNPTMTDPGQIKFTNSTGYSDTFLCSGTVEIKNEPVNMNLTLDRIVALCRFVIADNYPTDVLRMRFQYTGGSGVFSAISALGCVNSTQTVTCEVTTGLKQFDLYTFPLTQEGSTIHLTVSALDATNNVLREREFDVPVKRNQITTLTGNYFEEPTIQSTVSSVNILSEWQGETQLTY